MQPHFIHILKRNCIVNGITVFHHQLFRPLPEILIMENIDSIETSTKLLPETMPFLGGWHWKYRLVWSCSANLSPWYNSRPHCYGTLWIDWLQVMYLLAKGTSLKHAIWSSACTQTHWKHLGLFRYEDPISGDRDWHYTDKKVMRPLYLYIGNLQNLERQYLYWNGPQKVTLHIKRKWTKLCRIYHICMHKKTHWNNSQKVWSVIRYCAQHYTREL